MVKIRPSGESSLTSPNPMVVMVITVMYRDSRKLQPGSISQ